MEKKEETTVRPRGPYLRAEDILARPDVITRKNIKRTRAWCQYHGVQVPEWAAQPPARRGGRWSNYRGLNTYTAAACWCDLQLAAYCGLDCYWRNAERFSESLHDSELSALIAARDCRAVDRALVICRGMNPEFAVRCTAGGAR